MIKLIFLFSTLTLVLSLDVPKIGILSQPIDDHAEVSDQYKVMSNYVRFVESGGARAVIIHSYSSTDEIERQLNQLNGFIFPGGDRHIVATSDYFLKSAFILNKILELNDNGVYFPLLAICQGHEYLIKIIEPSLELEKVPNDHINDPLELTTEGRKSRMYRNLTKQEKDWLTTKNVINNYHNYGISATYQKKLTKLNEFFDVVAWGYDIYGVKYVQNLEAKQYPIYSVQHHPEKSLYNNDFATGTASSPEAVQLGLKFALFFANETRKNQIEGSLEMFDSTKHTTVVLEVHNYYLFDRQSLE